MSTGIRLQGNNAFISNVVVVGFDCAFDISGSSNMRMLDVRCDDVETAVRGSNVRGLLAERVTHNQGTSPVLLPDEVIREWPQQEVFQRNSIAYLVRMAAHGYV